MQDKMSAKKRKIIYGMATKLGIYDKNNRDDDLHAIVYRVTGKESISQLTDKEANQVIGELLKLKSRRQDRKHYTSGEKGAPAHRPGMINHNQQKTVWFYMYRLEDLDDDTPRISRAERLCAVIKKYLRLDAVPRDPFRFVSFDDGITLIEILKKMLRYEEQRAKKKSEVLSNRNG